MLAGENVFEFPRNLAYSNHRRWAVDCNFRSVASLETILFLRETQRKKMFSSIKNMYAHHSSQSYL
jgi:hypothetical protein